MLMRPACSPRHLQLEFQNSVNQHQSFVFYPALSFKRVFGRTLRLCGPKSLHIGCPALSLLLSGWAMSLWGLSVICLQGRLSCPKHHLRLKRIVKKETTP